MIRRQRRSAVVACVAVAALALGACGSSGSKEVSKSEIARWLRVSGGGDDPPEVIECLSDYMHRELTQEELRTWLAADPDEVTVEELQRLPRAIEIADQCRGVAGYG